MYCGCMAWGPFLCLNFAAHHRNEKLDRIKKKSPASEFGDNAAGAVIPPPITYTGREGRVSLAGFMNLFRNLTAGLSTR